MDRDEVPEDGRNQETEEITFSELSATADQGVNMAPPGVEGRPSSDLGLLDNQRTEGLPDGSDPPSRPATTNTNECLRSALTPARLSRLSAQRSEAGREGDGEGSVSGEEGGEDGRTSPVLITEIGDYPPEGGSSPNPGLSSPTPSPPSTPSPPRTPQEQDPLPQGLTEVTSATWRRRPQESVASWGEDATDADEEGDTRDEDWDTDLEDEDDKDEHDPTGRTTYRRLCQRLGVVPVSYFSRHITDTDLTMRYHGLGPLGTRAIARVLRSNITVERLDLSGNGMEGEGAFFMSRMLMENDYITELTLADNKLGTLGAQHLCATLQANSGLRHINLSGNDFGDDDAAIFAETIEQNKYLKTLVLSRNMFGSKAGELFGPAIGSNEVLEHLDLSWNQLRGKGAAAIANGLKENVRLRTCILSWNGLGPNGGLALADALTQNEALHDLDIAGNRLDTFTATAISKALKKNEDLQSLTLANNPITTTGSVALAVAIRDSDGSALRHLDLSHIPVEYEFLRTVQAVQSRRPLAVKYGSVMRSGNARSDLGKTQVAPDACRDPLLVLREHVVVNDPRILDILARYDTTETCTVTPEQFGAALMEIGVSMDPQQIDEVVKRLDVNTDGRIYFGDLVAQIEAASNSLQKGGTTHIPDSGFEAQTQGFTREISVHD